METDLRATFYHQMFRQLIGNDESGGKPQCQFCHRQNESLADQRSKESIINKITQFFETQLQF